MPFISSFALLNRTKPAVEHSPKSAFPSALLCRWCCSALDVLSIRSSTAVLIKTRVFLSELAKARVLKVHKLKSRMAHQGDQKRDKENSLNAKRDKNDIIDAEEVDEDNTDMGRLTRYNDGSVKLRNPNIELMDQDILYHLALGSGSHDLHEMFGDVKFVCMGGTPKRMETFAHFIMEEIGYKLPAGTQLQDISAFSYRYSMYKVGPVLSISHGMGVPSVGILLHELIKLMYHAKVKDPIFVRIGTCGGIGVEGGTVVITEDAYDGLLRNSYELAILGKIVHRPAILDKRLVRELKSLATHDDPYETITGKTMCTYDFYEGQGRLDGAFCEFSETDKMTYLEKLRDFGVVNIEMECTIFAALTHYAGIKAAIICVTLLDRLKGDQVMAPKEVMNEWQQRPQILVSRLIKKHLAQMGHLKSLASTPSSIKSPRRFKLVQQESEAHE